jgi:hypothetical protein
MKKPFAEQLQDMIDAYLEEHASTSLAVDVILYAMEQQCRLLRATNKPSKYLEDNEPTEESEQA